MRSLALLRTLIDDESDVRGTAYEKTLGAGIALYAAAVSGLLVVAPDSIPAAEHVVRSCALGIGGSSLALHHYLLTRNTPVSALRHRLGAVLVGGLSVGVAALLYTGRLTVVPALIIPIVVSHVYKWSVSLWIREEIQKVLDEAAETGEDS